MNDKRSEKVLSSTQMMTELISGFTIAILMIPEAIAFAFMLGLSPSVGIHSTIVMTLITSIFSGQPGLISGATAAVTTCLYGVSAYIGKEFVSLAVLMGGIIELLIGFFGIHNWIDLIPGPVSSGFLVGLAILIFNDELQHFKGNDGKWFSGQQLVYTLLLSILGVIITMYGFIVLQFQRVFKFPINIPGALVGIFILSMLFLAFPKMPIQRVKDKGEVGSTFPTFENPIKTATSSTLLRILPYSLAMAISGLTESLFTVKYASDYLKFQGDPLKETYAQGFANILSGLTGGMGGCVLVGQSKFNLENGAFTRLSSLSAGLSFLLFTVFFSKFIGDIPMPAIIAIMMVIVYKTGDWASLNKPFGLDWVTTVGTALVSVLTHNLAAGVLTGSAWYYIFKKFGPGKGAKAGLINHLIH